MNLQAKLTLGFVLLATLMVGLISGVNLDNEMQGQFEATLNRAATLESAATNFVRAAVNARPQSPLPKVLRDPALETDLADLFTSANAILEIAVVDPRSYEILADSSPDRLGKVSAVPGFSRSGCGYGLAGKTKRAAREGYELLPARTADGRLSGQHAVAGAGDHCASADQP